MILASVVVAITGALLVEAYADAPTWASVGVLIGLGVVDPTVLNGLLDRRGLS